MHASDPSLGQDPKKFVSLKLCFLKKHVKFPSQEQANILIQYILILPFDKWWKLSPLVFISILDYLNCWVFHLEEAFTRERSSDNLSYIFVIEQFYMFKSHRADMLDFNQRPHLRDYDLQTLIRSQRRFAASIWYCKLKNL